MQKLIIGECPSCGCEFMKAKQAILDSANVTCPMCGDRLGVTDGSEKLEDEVENENADEVENWWEE